MGGFIGFLVILLLPLPFVVMQSTGNLDKAGPLLGGSVCGLGLVAAASLLLLGAEITQRQLGPKVGLLVLALACGFPETITEFQLAWLAGVDSNWTPSVFAAATGTYRFGIGLGALLLLSISFFQDGKRSLELSGDLRLIMGFSLLASAYTFLLPLKGTAGPLDALVLIGLLFAFFFQYWRHASNAVSETPVLSPPGRWLEKLAQPWVSGLLALLFLALGGGLSFFAAESLLNSLGPNLENEPGSLFLPLHAVVAVATELPVLLLAAALLAQSQPRKAFSLLLLAALVQWTIGLAAGPMGYAIANQSWVAFTLVGRAQEAVLLAAAQGLLALVLLSKLRLHLGEAVLLAILYLLPWAIRDSGAQYLFAAPHFLLILVLGLSTAERRVAIGKLLRFGEPS